MEGLLFFQVYPSDGFRFILIPDGNPSHEFPVLDGNPSSNMNSANQDIQDSTLTIYINFRKFKFEKAPNFVTRPASNVDRRTPFGSEN
jgi:hypothetical protein